MKKPRAYVSVTNDLFTDNRVDKVCLFLIYQGYEVTLIGRKRKASNPLAERVYRTKRFRLIFEKGALFYAAFNIRLALFLLTRKRIDILVSNDLDTLLANYAAQLFRRKSKLVYDSHEYFTEVPELIDRPKVQRVWEKIERHTLPHVQVMYTVNASIAALYNQKYNRSVHIVRNVPPLWKPNVIPSKSELGIPENTFLIIIQGAGINIDRGAEEAVEAMLYIEHATLLIVGDGDVVPQLKKYVNDYDLNEKVLFFGKRPYHELMCFTYHASIGLTLDKPKNINYRFSLPNKVFDYIHAETPFICTNLVEVAQVVEKHQVGWVLETLNPLNLAKLIQWIQAHPSELALKKENCRKAALLENWENECLQLAQIYPTRN
jgi:glycosyltransferase involved in cell wall biosynthesis